MQNLPTVATLFSVDDHQVRVTVRNGEPWFCAADLCAVLGIRNTSDAISKHKIRENERVSLRAIPLGMGGPQDMLYVSESGLYKLILRSDSPLADDLIDHVAGKILPAIRKTGRYSVDRPPTDIPNWVYDPQGNIDRFDRDNFSLALKLLGITCAIDGREHPGSGRRTPYILGYNGHSHDRFCPELRRFILRRMKAQFDYQPCKYIVNDAFAHEFHKARYNPDTGQLFTRQFKILSKEPDDLPLDNLIHLRTDVI
jgi:BRO family protein